MAKITRRSFLASAAAVGAFRNIPSFAGTDDPPADAIVLENDRLRAVFDRKYGSLLTLENKQTGWRIQDRTPYGAAFRLQAPMPDRHYHFITEKDNPVESAEVRSGRQRRQFRLAQSPEPTCRHSGHYPAHERVARSTRGWSSPPRSTIGPPCRWSRSVIRSWAIWPSPVTTKRCIRAGGDMASWRRTNCFRNSPTSRDISARTTPCRRPSRRGPSSC